jgi:Transcription factor zinc-finger
MQCPSCEGQAITASLLQKELKPNLIFQLLGAASPGDGDFNDSQPQANQAAVATLAKTASDAPCPWCTQTMNLIDVPLERSGQPVQLDVCRSCQLLWFDSGEYKLVPKRYEEQILTPRVGELHCGHCGAPARPDLDSYCKYCQQPLAPARTPGVTGSSMTPRPFSYLPDDEKETSTPMMDVLKGLSSVLRLLG